MRQVKWSERLILGASGVTLALALGSWVLMRLGVYSLGRAGALAAACGFGLWLVDWRRRAWHAPREPWPWLALGLGVAVAFGCLYALYPTYFLLGGQDPGPYLAFAARVAKTGGMNLDVPEIQSWVREHPGLTRTFPAVYGDLAEPHGANPMTPQFVHLFTAFAANAWAASGVEGAVRVNAWPAVLCLATVFALLRRMGSLAAAVAVVVALGVNPAFIWASRITLTEMMALWLSLSGLLILLLAWDLDSRALAGAAGGVLGVGILNRLDGGIGALAILGFATASCFEHRSRRSAALAAGLVHILVSSACFADAWLHSSVYWESLDRESGSVSALIRLTLGLDLAALVLALIPLELMAMVPVPRLLKIARYAGVALVFAWVIYGLLVRPRVERSDDALSLRQLTWYLTWIAWPLVLSGFVWMQRKENWQRTLPLFAFAAGTLVIYTLRMDVAPAHIWASRRWLQHVIPLCLAAAALGGAWIVAWVPRRALASGVALLLAGLHLVPALAFDRPFLLQSMLDGLPKAYASIASAARKHRDRWPLLTTSIQLGSILTYLYDVPTVILIDPGIAALQRGDLTGSWAVGLNPFELRHTTESEHRYRGPYLEPSEKVIPSKIVDWNVPLELGEIGPIDFDIEVPASHPSLHTQVSRIARDGSVASVGQRGPLLYGPWTPLAAGRYRIDWYGRVESAGDHKPSGMVDVILDGGRSTVVEAPLVIPRASNAEIDLAGLDFTLKEAVDGLEFRVRVAPNVMLALTKVRLRRTGEPQPE